MPDVELKGIVVEQDPDGTFKTDTSYNGLYLKTNDGRLLKLIGGSMMQQTPVDMMWAQSRQRFEPFLGQQVTVKGYLSGRTIYSAIVEHEPKND